MDGLEWFDINNYDNVKNWGRADWILVIQLRRTIWRDNDTFYKKEINKLCELFNYTVTSGMFIDDEQITYDRDLVRDFCFLDFGSLYEDIFIRNKTLIECLNKACHELSEQIIESKDSDSGKLCIWDFGGGYLDVLDDNCLKNITDPDITDPEFRSSEIHFLAHINLDATDDQLIASFKNWLDKKREILSDTEGKKRRFNDSDFKEWHEMRLLAYIDLKLWSRLTRNNLTNYQISQLIFSDVFDIDITEKIRKTVGPKALNLMGEGFRRLL